MGGGGEHEIRLVEDDEEEEGEGEPEPDAADWDGGLGGLLCGERVGG